MPIRMFGFPKSYRSTLVMFYAQRSVSLDLASTSRVNTQDAHRRQTSKPEPADAPMGAPPCTSHSGQTPEAVALGPEVLAEVLHQLVKDPRRESAVDAMCIGESAARRVLMSEQDRHVLLERVCRAALGVAKAHAV